VLDAVGLAIVACGGRSARLYLAHRKLQPRCRSGQAGSSRGVKTSAEAVVTPAHATVTTITVTSGGTPVEGAVSGGVTVWHSRWALHRSPTRSPPRAGPYPGRSSARRAGSARLPDPMPSRASRDLCTWWQELGRGHDRDGGDGRVSVIRAGRRGARRACALDRAGRRWQAQPEEGKDRR
jgi:hypothetical protein